MISNVSEKLIILMMEAVSSSTRLHGATSQETASYIVITVST
jgi:hypothetical protein